MDMNELFNEPVVNQEITFPIYYKNKIGTIYTCLQSGEKFEQLTINKDGEAFRGSILFGFNEQWVSYKDNKLMFDSLLRLNEIVTQEEYDKVFNAILKGRAEFFTEDKFEYIEPVQHHTQEELNKIIKHRWKPLTK